MKTPILLIMLLLPLASRAQSESINGLAITSGGGTSTGGSYTATITLGQSLAGTPMVGGNFTVTAGFGLLQVVATPGAPVLTITAAGNAVRVWWPYPSAGWTLQQSGSLAAGWSASTGVVNDGTNNYLTITSPVGNQFFRLMHP